MQVSQQTAKVHKVSDLERLALRVTSTYRIKRDNLKSKMAEREEEQRRKDTALKTELQKIMASHFRKSRPVTSENHGQSLQKIMASRQKSLEKLMNEVATLRSDNQKLRCEVKDAEKSQALATAEATEARNKIATVRQSITARAAQRIQREKKKMETAVQDLFLKRKEELQQQIKAREQNIAQDTEVRNLCAGLKRLWRTLLSRTTNTS